MHTGLTKNQQEKEGQQSLFWTYEFDAHAKCGSDPKPDHRLLFHTSCFLGWADDPLHCKALCELSFDAPFLEVLPEPVTPRC
jgi:hypothetical protein